VNNHYDPAAKPGEADNPGMRYMQLLVEKYSGKLQVRWFYSILARADTNLVQTSG